MFLALVYLLKDSYSNYVSAPYFIALPVLFAAFVLLLYKGSKEYLIILALFFSGVGDLSGAFGNFILQISFFSIAHILYITAFIQKSRFSITGIISAILIVGVVLFYALQITIRIPVNERYALIVYSVIISVMCASSFLYDWQYRTLFRIGAVLFVISDGMIAWRMCMGSFPYSPFAIMTTYYLAQYLFTGGALKRGRQIA